MENRSDLMEGIASRRTISGAMNLRVPNTEAGTPSTSTLSQIRMSPLRGQKNTLPKSRSW